MRLTKCGEDGPARADAGPAGEAGATAGRRASSRTRCGTRAPRRLAEVRATLRRPADRHRRPVTRSRVAGRVMFLRNTGKLCFATLREGDGTELQAMLSLDRVGAEALAAWKAWSTSATTSAVTGEVITSRRGELSVLADRWAMTAKALRPLPVAHKPMSEEARVRQRYVDLIVRPQAREMVRARAAVVRSLRDSLHRRGFVEVETPMLQLLHGGAAARPFVTHSNALDIDLYLRIAPELFLKRCVVGGIERVFEINRNFRNEGVDSTHSPEFAMLEVYQAYGDYDTMAHADPELVQEAADRGLRLARGPPSRRYGIRPGRRSGRRSTLYRRAFRGARRGGHRRHADGDAAAVRGEARPGGRPEVGSRASWPRSCSRRWSCRAWSRRRSSATIPEETSPLIRAHRTEPGLAEKWDLYVRGFELGTGYSELVDPVVQRERFVARPSWPPRATPRRCGWTRTSCGPWSTACHRPAAWAWVSTGC